MSVIFNTLCIKNYKRTYGLREANRPTLKP